MPNQNPNQNQNHSKFETIFLAAGCFWGVQHLIDQIDGVISSRCGYMGGRTQNPTYRDVCSGDTQHAETVEVRFDPNVISLKQVLDYFWRLHDPTQLNRQGPDVGTQYRSAIFYSDEKQVETIKESKNKTDEMLPPGQKSVTEIKPAGVFYSAEDYHQKYFEKNPDGHICHVLRPTLKLR